MARLDSDDLKAVKRVLEEALDEAFEKGNLATKYDLHHLLTKEVFYSKMDEVMEIIGSIKST